jgi:hypothetical protein
MPFDTSLSPENEQRFNNWLQIQSKLRNRDVSQDLENYDLRGYWMNGGYKDAGQGHMPDTYKKPNHPTFSDESIYHDNKNYIGGHWTEDSFTPGKTNLQMHGAERLQEYFSKHEPDIELIMSK